MRAVKSTAEGRLPHGHRLALSLFLAANLLCPGSVRATLRAGLPAGDCHGPSTRERVVPEDVLLDTDSFTGGASCSEMRTLSLRDARSSLPGPALLLGTWVLGLWCPSQAVVLGSWAAAAGLSVGILRSWALTAVAGSHASFPHLRLSARALRVGGCVSRPQCASRALTRPCLGCRRAHTLTVLFILTCVLGYVTLLEETPQDTAYNTKR